MRKTWLLFFCLSLSAVNAAAGSSDLTELFIEARKRFESNLAGDQQANASTIAQFQTLVDVSPDHPLFLAYLGSAYTLKARDAWMPWTKMRHVEKGLDMVDEALVLLRPGHDRMRLRGSVVSIETRLVAISTFLQVPDFLNRLQPARDLIQETLEKPAFDQAPAEVRGRIYLNAADAARHDGEIDKARGLLRQAREILPDGPFRDEAGQRLEGE